jgi:hypothetical protein
MYCAIEDIQAEIKLMTFTTTSKPNIEEVEGKCESVSTEMDAVFAAAGIVLPLETDDQKEIAKQIAVLGTVARILRSVETKPDVVKMWQDSYDKRVAQVQKTPGILSASTVPSPTTPGHGPGRTQGASFTREGTDW